MKVNGNTKVKLYKCEDNKQDVFVKEDIFCNIVGYLYNRHLIELPDEYWIEDDNGWKSTYYKNYNKIFKNFSRLTNHIYSVHTI